MNWVLKPLRRPKTKPNGAPTPKAAKTRANTCGHPSPEPPPSRSTSSGAHKSSSRQTTIEDFSLPSRGTMTGSQQSSASAMAVSVADVLRALLQLKPCPAPEQPELDIERAWDWVSAQADNPAVPQRDQVEARLLTLSRPTFDQHAAEDQMFLRVRVKILVIAIKHGWRVVAANASEHDDFGLQIQLPPPAPSSILQQAYRLGSTAAGPLHTWARSRGRSARGTTDIGINPTWSSGLPHTHLRLHRRTLPPPHARPHSIYMATISRQTLLISGKCFTSYSRSPS